MGKIQRKLLPKKKIFKYENYYLCITGTQKESVKILKWKIKEDLIVLHVQSDTLSLADIF